MDVKDTRQHQRVLYIAIGKGELEGIIETAIAAKTGIPVADLREHGKLVIEPNMEGSPSYASGHKATFRATIPLPVPCSECGA